MAAIPIACELTDKELQRRRKEYLSKMAASLTAVEELDDGFRYRFPLGEKTLSDLAEIIDLERKCCPFLSFKLALAAGEEALSLELTGPDGTKEIVKSLFGWN